MRFIAKLQGWGECWVDGSPEDAPSVISGEDARGGKYEHVGHPNPASLGTIVNYTFNRDTDEYSLVTQEAS